MSDRIITKTYRAITQSEGAGAQVHRVIGNQALLNLDPFLLLDEFELTKAANSPGFPDHPHRGFETVTYMFKGSMTHADGRGNMGTIGPGEIQWMTAGSGLVHSETPDYRDGDVHGMQLWVNLPASDKMRKPRYQDIPLEDIPEVETDDATVRVIAGSFDDTTGPVTGIAIQPSYYDVSFKQAGAVSIPVGSSRTVFVYAVSDGLSIGGKALGYRTMAVMANGDTITVNARNSGDRFILVAGEPIGEPIARYGPFVMNTKEEIMAAIDDFNKGKLG